MGKLDGETAAVTGGTAGIIPRGETGRPDEIATAALFPASDDSGCGNGMELVDGGGTTAI